MKRFWVCMAIAAASGLSACADTYGDRYGYDVYNNLEYGPGYNDGGRYGYHRDHWRDRRDRERRARDEDEYEGY